MLVFPTILTTPVGTTSRLWSYLHDTLLMSADEVRQCALRYPSFLRANPASLTRKLEYLVAFQALVKAMVLAQRADICPNSGMAKGGATCQDLLSRLGGGKSHEESFCGQSSLEVAVARVLRSVAALLVRQNGIIFTFSDMRISTRLLDGGCRSQIPRSLL